MSEKEITLQEMSRLMNNVLKYEGKAIDAIRPEGINKKKAEIKAELARMDLKPEDKPYWIQSGKYKHGLAMDWGAAEYRRNSRISIIDFVESPFHNNMMGRNYYKTAIAALAEMRTK